MSHSKDQKDLTYLLTSREKQAVVLLSDHYMTKYGQDPTDAADLCFYLGDNPTYAVTWSAESMKVPCFRNSNGLYWIPSKKRWVTLREKLACLGLPVDPVYSQAMGVPPLLCRDAHRAASLIGNSMHLSSVALVTLVGLVSFGKKNA